MLYPFGHKKFLLKITYRLTNIIFVVHINSELLAFNLPMILLIVDNSVFRENLKEAFELSNYHVCDLEKPSDSELLSDIKPDLVVYCNTKDINGRRFCNWVIGNKMFNNLPIILLTHDKIEQKNEKDQTYVGCNCIQLPFDPNNLLELVEGLLTELET